MAHTAGPNASVAAVVVDLWNWVTAHAARTNIDRPKAFDQLSSSLRKFITATTEEMMDTVDAQFAWRLPIGVDAETLVADLAAWSAIHLAAPTATYEPSRVIGGEPLKLEGLRTEITRRFGGWEKPWRGHRQNFLVRSFLTAIRAVDAAAQPGFLVKTGTSDMNVVGPLWECPIVAYGPGDSALDHTPHEHVSLDEYWRAVNVMEAMLCTFAASS